MKKTVLITKNNPKTNISWLVSRIGIVFLCAFLSINLLAQVAINEDGSAPSADVELDIKSTKRGVLLPLLTTTQRDAIPSPVVGLLIFNRSGGYFDVYDGTNWLQISREVALSPSINPADLDENSIGVGVGVAEPDSSAILHVNDTIKGFLLPRTAGTPTATAGMFYYSTFSNSILYYDGTDWVAPGTTTSSAGAGGAGVSEGLLIGSGTIDASAKMEIQSVNDRGMFFPRMADADRDLIDDPEEGLLIYNTTDNEMQYFAASTWYKWSTGAPALGTVASNPGQSCKDIYDNNPASVGVDGLYFIDPDGVGGDAEILATCDMTNYGGGWTLVLNSGAKRTNMENPGQIGSFPITKGSAGDAAAKFSDANIDLVRGVLSSSILWFEPQFGNGTELDVFFKENKAYTANSTVRADRIEVWNTSYANAVSGILMLTETSAFDGALCNWNSAGNAHGIIMSHNAEELIHKGANHTCSGVGLSNRSACNGLVWVKQP